MLQVLPTWTELHAAGGSGREGVSLQTPGPRWVSETGKEDVRERHLIVCLE